MNVLIRNGRNFNKYLLFQSYTKGENFILINKKKFEFYSLKLL